MRNETCTYEQKRINVGDFNEVEEKEVNERVEKRKEKRREVAEKNKLLKKNKKTGRCKVKEKVMWKRLGELKKEFNEVKKSKKDSKKMSESIIKT